MRNVFAYVVFSSFVFFFFFLKRLVALCNYKLRDRHKPWAHGCSYQHISWTDVPKRKSCRTRHLTRPFFMIQERASLLNDRILCRQFHPAQRRFVKYLSFYYKVTWIFSYTETRGVRGYSGIFRSFFFFTFMYIIIYIINYNEYIVMYNIESHSLTITSTTWLNNVPHWYTNCKCTDKKALDEVQWGIEGGVRSARLNSLFSLYIFL